MADPALKLYRKRLREVLASIQQGERDLASIHASVSEEIIAKLRGTPANTNVLELEAMFRAEFDRTAFKRVRLTKQLIEQGAKAGPKTVRETLREAFGDQLTQGQVRTSPRALKQAGERIAGRVTVDGVSLSKRIRRVDRETSLEMAQEIERSIKSRKGILGAAKKIERLDTRTAELPRYLQQLESAARAGNVKEVKSLSKRFLARVKSMGEWQPDGTFKASKFSLRGPTQRFVKDIEKASGAGIDKIVQRYVTEKAAFRAAVIARTEVVEAYRRSYIDQAKGKRGVHGFVWKVSPTGGHKPDVCDVYASANSYGLGPGCYPADKVPTVPHPCCRCSVVARVDRDSMKKSDAEARETPESMKDSKSPDAVGWYRQNDAAARAILGPTRHSLMQQGVRVTDDLGKPLLLRDVFSSMGKAAE